MKRILLFLSVMLLFWACKNETRQIESVAYAYLDAMGNYRIEEAEAYASDETIETTLHWIENNIMAGVDTNAELAQYIKSNTPATITINKVGLLNDSVATVNFTKVSPIQTHSRDLSLVKRNGEWKVFQIIQVPDVVQYALDTNRTPRADTTGLRVSKTLPKMR